MSSVFVAKLGFSPHVLTNDDAVGSKVTPHSVLKRTDLSQVGTSMCRRAPVNDSLQNHA